LPLQEVPGWSVWRLAEAEAVHPADRARRATARKRMAVVRSELTWSLTAAVLD
jgi:hypothetical protein